MDIQVKKSTMVQPAQETPKKRLWVSDLDLLVLRGHMPTVYFYKKPNGTNSANFFNSEVLIEALSKALVSFYPLAGRLGTRDEDGRIEVNCNGEGALFNEVQTDASLSDFGDFRPSQKLRQLIPIIDYSKDLSSYPLLILQVTFFKCGGVCLGTLLHHTLVDGISALHFINTWSDMARCHSTSAVPPFMDRTFLRPRVPPNPTFHHTEYDPYPAMIAHSQTHDVSTDHDTTSLLLKLTLEQINALKARSKNDIDDKTARPYSTYELLTAHIWRCICKARGLADEQPTQLYMAVDGRSRLHPPLPPGFFGNVAFPAKLASQSGDILSNPLNNTAEIIRCALKRMDDEYLRSAIDFLGMQANLTALVCKPHMFRCPNVKVISWRLDVHESDFGWGRPIFMGPACILFPGTGYILPSPSHDGSLSLAVCLETPHMELFKKFFYDSY